MARELLRHFAVFGLVAALLSAQSPRALAQLNDLSPPPAYPPTSPPAPFSVPPPLPAPLGLARSGGDQLLGTSDGQRDADTETSGLAWFGVGCLLNLGGVLIGYLIAPQPDATRMLGRSSAYVASYTDAFRREGKSFQGLHALYGCVTYVVVAVGIAFLIYASTRTIPAG